MNKEGLLRISIGTIYLWFGGLKFFPGLSPAEGFASDTIEVLTFHLLQENTAIFLLAILETLIGLFLMFKVFLRQTIIVSLIHLILTFTPLVAFPAVSFIIPPYSFTLLGQYIMKNLVLISALFVVFPTKTNN